MGRTIARFLVLSVALLTIRCGNGSPSNSPPSTPVVSNTSSETFDNVSMTYTFDLVWEASTDPDGDAVEYYGELYEHTGGPLTFPYDFDNNGMLYANSGWTSALTWSVSGVPQGSLFVFRVKARDTSGAESDWGVWENDMLGSCPFIFVWDGTRFVFESDIFPGARLGTRGFQGYMRPYPIDYYVLTSEPALKDGAYEVQMTGERDEVDYLDEAQLLALYHAEDTAIFAERAPLGVSTFPGIDRLHTARLPLAAPVSIRHVNTDADVTAQLGAMDDDYLTLNDDNNVGFTYQTLEVDLGDLSGAQQIKLIIDGQSVFPNTPEGLAHVAQFGPRTRIEVPDASGAWTEVPRSVVEMPNLTGFRRVIVLDVTNAFLTNDFRIRLTWLFKNSVDAVLFDTSLDEPIRVVPLPLVSADLHYRGFSGRTPGERYDLVYEQVTTGLPEYFPGAYTKYGDVRELLTDPDDRFAIFFGGDEITLRYGAAQAPAPGEKLSFTLMTNGYYKDANIDLPSTVDPLPFAAMSNYPYDAAERYPDDAFHYDYQQTWNTRIHPTR